MRMLTAAVLTTVAALSAPVAQAETDDERFLALLAGYDVPVLDVDAAIANAHKVCAAFDRGDSVADVIDMLSVSLPSVGSSDASFVRASVYAYCPSFLPEPDENDLPDSVSVPSAAPKAPAPKSSYYPNCAAARAAGAAPIYRGDPGYSSSLDRDGDGVACEK